MNFDSGQHIRGKAARVGHEMTTDFVVNSTKLEMLLYSKKMVELLTITMQQWPLF